ncbi:Endochitinase B1 [Penicillium daleae]|uniref:chitinase n=1 Tax=Penicillium daleae TaxID=63821 RepID=A0AAD6CGI9_9EURO|nr:Endochitinase B1 [Penicillium daleae]KAJ5461898.1 Endochitinase B1 [Penicillium daleae]
MVSTLQQLRLSLDTYSAAEARNYHFLISVAYPAGIFLRAPWICYFVSYLIYRTRKLPKSPYISHRQDTAAGHNANIYPSTSNPSSTPFNTNQAIDYYISQGVTSGKINMGMPLYGRSFLNTNGPGTPYSGVGSGSWENGVWDYKALPRAEANVSYLDQPIASYSYDASQEMMISYDTPQVAEKKAEANIDVVRLLLDFGADVNAPPAHLGMTALQAAAGGGSLLGDLILSSDTDVKARLAAEPQRADTGYLEVIRLLLNSGADINAPPGEVCGRTALQAAVERGYLDIIQLLLSAGADINAHPAAANGMTALQAAAKRGNLELVKLLLSSGADVNAPSAPVSGMTALQAAAKSGSLELVRVLLSSGAHINAPPAEAGTTTFKAKEGGRTALQAAASGGNIEVVQLLLGAGADVNAPPAKARGRTALQAATEAGNLEVAQLLLWYGADIHAPPSEEGDMTAFQAALEEGNFEIVQLLLDNEVMT